MGDQRTEQQGLAPEVPAEGILWRIDSKAFQRESSPTGWVARYVPYLNASTAAALLDEWVGAANWFDQYEPGPLPNTLWCHLTICRPDGSIPTTKTDLGVSPGGDAEMAAKGMVSDAFKRAAILKWGVGRNVYSLPSLWAPCKERDGKSYPADEAKPILTDQLRALGFDVAATALDDNTDV